MEDCVTDNEEKLTSGGNSPPHLPADSPGSSVSSRMQEEYTELLKYTVNSVTLTEDGFEAENGLELEGPVFDKNVNNNENTSNVLKLETAGSSCHRPATRSETTQRSKASVDSIAVLMATKLDGLLGSLKDNILAELTSLLITSLEAQNLEQRKEMNELTSEKVRLEKEINKLNEAMNGMQQSIGRKDTLIDNLTQSLAAQKGKTEMALKFYNWKASHLDNKREKFTEKLAAQHHSMKISHRVFKAWFGLIQTRWRSKVERVCQEQAQGVCLQLTNDYEAKISSLNETVRSLETKVTILQTEREAYADQVKKAFMRGVCALNMEAMSAFNNEQQQSDSSFFDDLTGLSDNSVSDGAAATFTIPQEESNCQNEAEVINSLTPFPVTRTSSAAADTSHSIDITSNNMQSNLEMSQPVKDIRPPKSMPTELVAASLTDLHNGGPNLKPQIKCGSSIKTKATHSGSKTKTQSQILAPPMASVVVERHQPITKQTIGKATAIRYPKQGFRETTNTKSAKGGNACKRPFLSSSTVGQHFKPLAGQTTKDDHLNTQALSIKVVD